MPSLTISDADTPNFDYLDSGEPKTHSGVYTTVVVVHGHSFHSGIFQRALHVAASRGPRLICVNRRDYAGTTLFTPAELKVISEGNETERDIFLGRRGIEMALFISRIIDELSLPPPTADDKDGGIALMGWSLGNMVPLAIVASVSSLPARVRSRLQLYLRRMILHSPPSLVLGVKDPPNHYNPFHDNSVLEEQRDEVFVQWASSYFEHGELSTRNLNNLAQKDPDPSRESSVSRMSPQEFASVVDFDPGPRSDVYFHTRFQSVLFRQTRKALFDAVTRALWPHLKVWMLYGDSSPWPIIHAAWELEKMGKASGEQAVMFSLLKDANTFVFWDEPEKALNACVYCLGN